MANDRFVETSGRIYAALLRLYPRSHRSEYGAEMQHLFSDQCKEAARASSGFHNGICRVALWIRTLFDLFVSVFKEHVSAPGANLGLLEAPPNAPLPWKGVALVLIPGLIFFISQVGQLTGVDWFYWMFYRGGYFLMLPVLVVWIWKRKFPVWGLIPLGILCQMLASAAVLRLPYYLMVLRSAGLQGVIHDVDEAVVTVQIAVIVVTILGSLFLVWLIRRRNGIPAWAWFWLGLYLLLMLGHILLINWYYVFGLGKTWLEISVSYAEKKNLMLGVTYNDFIYFGAFLVIVLLGALLARRHGRLAVLLPLGYLLPSVIYGRISDDWPGSGTPEFTFMLTVSAAALMYRFLVGLGGPLWIVRSASGKMRKKAGAASLLALLGIQIAFNIWFILTQWQVDNWSGLIWIISGYSVALELIQGVGIGLALALYRDISTAGEETVERVQVAYE